MLNGFYRAGSNFPQPLSLTMIAYLSEFSYVQRAIFSNFYVLDRSPLNNALSLSSVYPCVFHLSAEVSANGVQIRFTVNMRRKFRNPNSLCPLNIGSGVAQSQFLCNSTLKVSVPFHLFKNRKGRMGRRRGGRGEGWRGGGGEEGEGAIICLGQHPLHLSLAY